MVKLGIAINNAIKRYSKVVCVLENRMKNIEE